MTDETNVLFALSHPFTRSLLIKVDTVYAPSRLYTASLQCAIFGVGVIQRLVRIF